MTIEKIENYKGDVHFFRKNRNEKYVCQDCGKKYSFADFLFQSLANPYSCPDCERDNYNNELL